MKKYLFSALAMGLILTSCQSDEPFATGESGEKQVTFTLNVPSDLGTRANEGYKSDEGGFTNTNGSLSYTLVLTANGDSQTLRATGEDKQVVFTPTVVLGRNYTVTAYAHFGDALDDLTKIEINKDFNDESKDAYTWTGNINFATAGTEQNLTLTRPYGKLRLVATDYNVTGSSLNTAIESVKVTYNDRNAATFNAVTGKFDFVGDYVNASTADAFDGYYAQQTDGTTTLTTLFADYIPANDQDNMVDFTVEVKYANSGETYSRTFSDIPVRRNGLTTLRGNFFTANAEISVEVEEEFESYIPGENNAEEQLRMAIAMGGTYTLTDNVTLTSPLNITNDMTINLNGKTISYETAKNNGAVIEVANGVKAKLVGGSVKSTATNGDAAINNAGELVLENIAIEGAPLADGGYSAYAVISSGKLIIEDGVNVSADRGCLKFSGAGETVINGGSFTNNDIGSKSLTSHVVDVEDGGTHKLTINGGTFAHLHTATSGGVVICNRTKGTVYVNGGNFSGGNYYGNNNLSDYGYGGTFVVTGGTYSAKPADKYIATGYKAVQVGDKYIVVSNNTTVLSNAITESNADDFVTNYVGEFFENQISDALYFNNCYLLGDATINVQRTYGAVILENVKGELNGDVIVVDNDQNSVMVLQNCDFTLEEGKKLIKSVKTIYQVFMSNITINGVKLTNENAAQYLENVGWYQVVDEI